MEQNSAKGLSIRVVTPKGVCFESDCDSVVLKCASSSDGVPNGSIGIRKGHADAVIALGAGEIVVSDDTKGVIGRLTVSGGIATVSKNLLSVITNGAEDDKKQ